MVMAFGEDQFFITLPQSSKRFWLMNKVGKYGTGLSFSLFSRSRCSLSVSLSPHIFEPNEARRDALIGQKLSFSFRQLRHTKQMGLIPAQGPLSSVMVWTCRVYSYVVSALFVPTCIFSQADAKYHLVFRSEISPPSNHTNMA